MIDKNNNRVKKDLKSVVKGKTAIDVISFDSSKEAIQYLLEYVKNVKESKSIALISRKRSQIIPYQIFLAKEGIKYYCPKDLHVLLSNTFENLLSFLECQYSLSGKDGVMLFDAVNLTVKVLDKVYKKPLAKKVKGNIKEFLYEFLGEKVANGKVNHKDIIIGLENYANSCETTNEKKYGEQMAKIFRRLMESVGVSDIISCIETNYLGFSKDFGKSGEDIFFADPPFIFLSDFAEAYGDSVLNFVNDVKTARERFALSIETLEPDKEEVYFSGKQKSEVYLLTALRAKGREFDVVVILDAVDGIWPSHLSDFLEEERRLFYVAMTRVREKLIVTVPKYIAGRKLETSPFVMEAGLR